jgi:outer membrane receptor protein involved in Fe transport
VERENLRASLTGYHAWMFDYITFENTGDTAQQVDLRFVNTDLARRFGVEGLAECQVLPWMTPFATLEYVQGDDLTRTGDFATRRAGGGLPSERIAGLPRGFFGSVVGGDNEPLAGILPLQSRAGLRLHAAEERPRWLIELAARMVDDQDRIAASLRETPTPGFTVWDVHSHFRATENWLLLGAVENFTDRTYREHLDFRALDGSFVVFRPGISFFFGSELTY